MKYHKIRGKSVAECMMKLRSEYGSAAIILATREVKEGGLLGSGLLSRKLYEIDFMLQESERPARRLHLNDIAERSKQLSRGQVPDPERLRRSTGVHASHESPGAGAGSDALPDVAAKPVSTGVETRGSSHRANLEQRANALLSSMSADSNISGQLEARKRVNSPEEASPGTKAAADGSSRTPEIQDETLTRLSGMTEREALALLLAEETEQRAQTGRPLFSQSAEENALGVTESNRTPAIERGRDAGTTAEAPAISRRQDSDADLDRNLEMIRRRLELAQMSREFTDRFLQKLDHSLSALEKKEYRNVEQRTLKNLAEIIRTVPDIAPPGGECRAVMLLGPTGSGKTTSLAKLAARYHIFESRDVSLYSLDHYRLAATEQLKTYASVMGLPFFAPLSPQEFAEYLRRDGAELMLIDTSGIGYRDQDRLAQLQEYIEASKTEVRLEKHLVLAANTSPAALEKILLAYDRIGFDKLILTKLDESDFIGAFIEVADKYNRPFSFLMNGQDVPGDIAVAESEGLARMILEATGSR